MITRTSIILKILKIDVKALNAFKIWFANEVPSRVVFLINVCIYALFSMNFAPFIYQSQANCPILAL
uniref:Uncharacterized protein n=1 Tax=Romanomermis culicivorax TaxID=13658 RepID=A0A915KMM2_ROMCU